MHFGAGDWYAFVALGDLDGDGDEDLAVAILDGFLHDSHVLDIKGCSCRLRDL
ncbi:MAG: ATP-binding protein [Candidatus Eisenbacteria bacterium]